MKVRKAIIPAAGLGTRFLPATKAQPKEMLPIVDKPTIQYIIEEAVASGIEDIIIEPRGLGHAILTARHFVGNEPFAVLLGDDVVVSKKPCLQQMLDVFAEYRTSVLGVQEVAHEVVNKYGIVDCKNIEDRVYKVHDLVEKPKVEDAPSNIAILGRYIITPSIFSFLETQDAGTGGEIQLTDALKRLAQEEAMYAYAFKGHRYDVGTKCGFLQANLEFSLRNPETRDEMRDYIEKLHDHMDQMLDYE